MQDSQSVDAISRRSSFLLDEILKPFDMPSFDESLEMFQDLQWGMDTIQECSEEQQMSEEMSQDSMPSMMSSSSSSVSYSDPLSMSNKIALKCGAGGSTEEDVMHLYCEQNPSAVSEMTKVFVKNGGRTKEVLLVCLRDPSQDLEGLVRFFLQSPRQIFFGPMVSSWIFFNDEQQLQSILNVRADLLDTTDQVLEPKIEHLRSFRVIAASNAFLH